MTMAGYFRYVGEPTLTRGNYGVAVRGGHQNEDGMIAVFDPDYGDREWISVEAGLASGDWVPCSAEEWAAL